MPIDWWTDRWNVAYPYNGTLLRNKQEQTRDTRYNMDEPPKRYAKWKANALDHILYDSTNTKRPEKANLQEEKEVYGLPTAAARGKQGVTANGCQGSFRDDGKVLKLDSGDDCTIWQIH